MKNNNIDDLTKSVNNSIDENKIKEINNRIKTKKIPLFVKFLAIVGMALLIFFISFYAIKYSKRFIEAGEVKPEETTTISPQVKSDEYFKKDIVRKYENEDTIVLFLPRSLYNIVFFIKHDSKDVTEVVSAVYEDDYISYSMDEYLDYSIVPNGIKIGEKEYKISSGEMKYYVKPEEVDSSILIVNATPNALYGVGLLGGVQYQGKYMEDDKNITITQGSVKYEFAKKNNNTIVYNDYELILK